MSGLLAIDIGNTNITCGLFRGKKLVKKLKIPSDDALIGSKLRKLCKSCGPCGVIVSSVAPRTLAKVIKGVRPLLGKSTKGGLTHFVVLGKDAAVPIKNLYKRKREVGQDRLVNAFAARELYGAPAVVIDFGTAVTFDIVSRKGEYLGGLIMPGIKMSLASLYEKTALLPRVKLKAAKDIIGKDTVNSIRGGILFGLGAMCDGLVARYKKNLGRNLKVIATGGNARLIKRYAKSIQVVDEDLTLKGLRLAAFENSIL